MRREDLIREFWKKAKNPTCVGQPYTAAIHHVIDLLTSKESTVFVPKKSCEHEVTLDFNNRGCTLQVDGVNVLSLRGDKVVLHTYVSGDVTGLSVHPKMGFVNTVVEA